MENERATEIAGGSDGGCGGCDDPPACKFVELVLARDVGGGGNFTPAPPVFVFAFPPAVP
jgi:hypothetical protein